MLIEKTRAETLKEHLAGRNVKVITKFAGGELLIDDLTDMIPEENTRYLVDVENIQNPVVEAVRNTPVGETVEIENADGSTTEWIVLDKTEDRAELLAADCVDERPFHQSAPYPGWSKSDIRAWLNGEYYNSLGEDMRKAIVEQSLATATDYKWEQKEKTKDKVYLLAENGYRSNRVVTPSGVGLTPERLQCADEIEAYYWWLRSPRNHEDYARIVTCSDGSFTNNFVNFTYGVRPAVTIAI